MTRTSKPYGLWPSPVSAELAAAAARRIGTAQSTGGWLWWVEGRPEEKGRQTLLRGRPGVPPQEMIAAPWSARSRVHEYGGGEFLATDDRVFFVNDADQDIYALDHEPGRAPERITRQPDMRFADMAYDAERRRLIAVAERRRPGEGAHEPPENLLVAIALEDEDERGMAIELAQGMDFFSSPRLSADGKKLAFLAWNLPDMPWESAALYVTDLRGDGLGRLKRIAGGRDSAAFQPEWAADGGLHFVWDKDGWGNLYCYAGGEIRNVLAPHAAELSRPQWVFGMRSYSLNPHTGEIAAVFLERGEPDAMVLQPDGMVQPLAAQSAPRIDDPMPYGDGFAAVVGEATRAPALVAFDRGGAASPVSTRADLPLDADDLSVGTLHDFRRPDGEPVYALYYPPTSARFRGPDGDRPPALVFAHGGPTSMADRGLKLRTQFFTSRGFAVLDVDYSGSTGYGRRYRQRLDGQWGIADVADCAAGARHLADAGLADAGRIAIAGGSAGGYTVLMALATTDAFAAGSCHYGISDLALLLAHTHKFESGYLHRLLGTTPRSWKTRFRQRSPLTLIDRICAPVILFQGLEDKVVPPEQSERIVASLRKRGVKVDYHAFEGEGHGFRRAETIAAVLEAELAFLREALRLA